MASLDSSMPASPRVPPELCDEIIDAFIPPPSKSCVPHEIESNRIHTLVTCTLVCRTWGPRAKENLYKSVWVDSGASLFKLMRTLVLLPHIVPKITRLVVAPPVWDSLDDPVTDYLPLIPFLSMKSPITHIQLINLIWVPGLYQGQYVKGFHTISLVRLEIISVVFPSLREFLPLLSCSKALVHLALVSVYFKTQPTDAEIAQMVILPFSASLRRLHVGGEGPGVPGVHLLGDKIEHFRLAVQVGNSLTPSLEHYRACIPRYSDLNTLRITLEPWANTLSPPTADAAEGARVWGHIHNYLLQLLQAVQNPTVRRLEIALLPQQQEPQVMQDADESAVSLEQEPSSLPCRYRNTRPGLLDTLLASDIRDILVTAPFANVAALDFVICDSTERKGWWHEQIQERLRLKPDVIRVDLRPSEGMAYSHLWD